MGFRDEMRRRRSRNIVRWPKSAWRKVANADLGFQVPCSTRLELLCSIGEWFPEDTAFNSLAIVVGWC